MASKPMIQAFFGEPASYLVADPVTRKAAVDPVARRKPTRMPIACPAAPYIKAKTGAKIGIGEHIKDVQRIFRPIFNATDLKTDGSDFDHLFRDSRRFNIGELSVEICKAGLSPPCFFQRIGRRRTVPITVPSQVDDDLGCVVKPDFPREILVGVAGFEPATPSSRIPSWRAASAFMIWSHTPALRQRTKRL